MLKALTLAREHGARTALDIDYRPNLWGVAGHGEGESRFVESAEVTAKLQATLHLFDLIVGTEEEFHIAGGSTDTIAALRAVRAVSRRDARLQARRQGRGRLRGRDPGQPRRRPDRPRLPDRGLQRARRRRRLLVRPAQGLARPTQDWPTALKYANACGAFAVSRHGCTPAYPSLGRARVLPRPRHRPPRPAQRRRARAGPLGDQPAQHAATGRRCGSSPSTTGCSSSRWTGATPERIGAFKQLCLAGGARGAGRPPRLRHPLRRPARPRARCTPPRAPASGSAGPCEWPGSRPLTLEPELGSDYGGLAEWAREDVVKVLCFCHPDDTPEMRAEQEATVKRLWEAARRNRLEFLLEIIPSKVGAGRRRHHRDADPAASTPLGV